jgi:hypothetical protein
MQLFMETVKKLHGLDVIKHTEVLQKKGRVFFSMYR